ncbi:MAG: hypothetical protein M3680_15210 [Myxococcota bacterium]|nr:hypothetical protein [Myxococcota bacterium]
MGVAELRAELATAVSADDGSSASRRHRLGVMCRLVIALVDDLVEDEADAVIAELGPLLRHDAELEIEIRRGLARELAPYERFRAVVQLSAALECASAHGLAALEADLTRELGELLRDGGTSTLRTTSSALDEASRAANPELAARMQLSLSARTTGAAAEQHARTSLELAKASGDVALIHETAVQLAELLADREQLEDAEGLLAALPPYRGARESRALLDEVRRRLGELVLDPPEEPDQPLATADRHALAWVTRPHNLAQAVLDGGLLGPDKLREWSSGPVFKPSELESQLVFGPVRSFWCACGRYRGRDYEGMVCRRCGVEVVHASARRTRIGHITLAEPVVHPWYVTAAAQLLDLPVPTVDAMPARNLRDRLQAIDLARLVEDLRHGIVTASKPRYADQAGRRLALVEAFRTASERYFTRPDSIVLELVPVVPPNADLAVDRGKLREAYAELLVAPAGEQRRAVRGLFAALAG